jgi:hypothetical protein
MTAEQVRLEIAQRLENREDMSSFDMNAADGTNCERPCPWVTCRHHLYLDISAENGSIKINFPGVEVEDLKESCSLDIAERGGKTLKEVGDILDRTRERIRQLESKALLVIRQSDVAKDP